MEIVTCIQKWIESQYQAGNFEKLVVFIDNCVGQNKNINIMMNHLSEVQSCRLFEIILYYLVPGHSYMACDWAFGNIEKVIRRHGDIHSMENYCNIIKDAVHTGYAVIQVQRAEFLDVGAHQKYIVHRKSRTLTPSHRLGGSCLTLVTRRVTCWTWGMPLP